MRLRRALVQDVYNALQHAGNVKLGVPDTPDSHAGARRGRRSDAEGERLPASPVHLRSDSL